MKKNLNKLATLALTGAMIAGMSFGAFADQTTAATSDAYNPTDGVLTKTVLTDGKTYAPNTTFNFEVSALGESETIDTTAYKTRKEGDAQDLKQYLKKGTKDQADNITLSGVEFKADRNNDGQLTSADLTDRTVTLANGVTANGFDGKEKSKISIAAGTFTEPGIYVFNMKETEGSYSGVTYNKGVYYMLVTVVYSDDQSKLEVKAINFADKTTGVKFDTLYNNYGAAIPETPDIPNIPSEDKVYDLTVSKSIMGATGVKGDKFKFVLNVEKAEGSADGDYAVYNADGSFNCNITSNGTTLEVTDGISYTINGLSAGDKVTLKELDDENKGYTATYTLSGTRETVRDAALDGTNGATVEAKENGATMKVTNTRGNITVTGVAMSIAPYAAMVLGAGAFAGIFLGMKKKDDEE